MVKDKTAKRKTIKKSNKANNTLSPEKVQVLETLFLIGGISSHAASKEAGVDPKTATIYFEEFAERLVEDKDHLTWAIKEKYARARYQEGLTKRIMTVRNRLTYFQNRLTKIITVKKGSSLIANDKPNEVKLEKYERYVRNTEIQLSELQQEYAMIDMMPPTEILIQKEIENMIEKMNIET